MNFGCPVPKARVAATAPGRLALQSRQLLGQVVAAAVRGISERTDIPV